MDGIEEANRRIKKCLENQETELDLSQLKKEEPELKECRHLTVLNLSFNSITNIDFLEGLLPNLTFLE